MGVSCMGAWVHEGHSRMPHAIAHTRTPMHAHIRLCSWDSPSLPPSLSDTHIRTLARTRERSRGRPMLRCRTADVGPANSDAMCCAHSSNASIRVRAPAVVKMAEKEEVGGGGGKERVVVVRVARMAQLHQATVPRMITSPCTTRRSWLGGRVRWGVSTGRSSPLTGAMR